jgi:POT family proton-dependent oligopeptide transporter
MIVGVLWLKARENTLDDKGLPPNTPESKLVLDAKDWRDIVIYAIALVIATFAVVFVWGKLPDSITTIITYVGFAVGIFGLGYVIFKGTNGSSEWSRMIVILVLAFFNIAFWAGFEQAGGTMNLFAKENTNRLIGSWNMPATWFQNINPIVILIFAPIFSVMWLKLDKMKINPRTPIKFAIGLFLGALAFWIMTMASHAAEGGTLVSPWWLVVVYFVLTIGELMLSPIGLSMITKLAPPKLISIVMGLWMASFAAGNYLAAMLESILEKYHFELYPFIMWMMIGSGVSLLLLSPFLNKAMKGIH